MKRILFLFICFLHLVDHAFGQGYKFEWEDKFSTVFDMSAQNNYKICVKQYDSTIDLDPGTGVFNLPGSGFALIKFDTNDNFIWAKPTGFLNYYRPFLIKIDHLDNIIIITKRTDSITCFLGDGMYKFDSQGNNIWSLNLDGWALTMDVDSNNNIFIWGQYYYGNTTPYDIFSHVRKVSSAGTLLWTKEFKCLSVKLHQVKPCICNYCND